MLGSLARWLRFFGFDCEFADVTLSDEEVAQWALKQGRWLLTRDRELASTGPPRSVMIRSEDLDAQLIEVFNRLALRPVPNLDASRCGECNGELIEISREDVEDEIPPYVQRNAERFKRCQGCARIYWPGTHSTRILERLVRISRGLTGVR